MTKISNYSKLEYILSNYYTQVDDNNLRLESFTYPFTTYILDCLDYSNFNDNHISEIKNSIDTVITEELLIILMKCLTLEYEIIRLKNPSFNNKEILNEMTRNKKFYFEFFELYPPLLDLILKRIEFFIDNINTFVQNIRMFLPKKTIDSIHLNAGDSHQNGKRVFIFSIETRKYVYKPKEIELDTSMDKVLSFISSNLDLSYSPRKIYPYSDFVIEEFINNSSCRTIKEIEDYYYKFGVLLGVVFSLRGTDIHFENLIARMDTPVIIDTETLLQPEIGIMNSNFSILSTNMIRSEKKKVDFSALSGDAQLTNIQSEKLVYNECEQPTFEKENVFMDSRNNIPLLNGVKEKVNPQYLEEVINGLSNCIKYIIAHKQEYIQLIRKEFSNKKIRIILKSTNNYFDIILKMTHPDNIKNYQAFLNFIEKNSSIHSKGISDSEIQSLFSFDIPYFTANTSDKFIYNESDNIIHDFKLSYSPLDYVINNINSLDNSILKKQISILINNYKNTEG